MLAVHSKRCRGACLGEKFKLSLDPCQGVEPPAIDEMSYDFGVVALGKEKRNFFDAPGLVSLSEGELEGFGR